MGSDAAERLTTGSSNIAIGKEALKDITTASNNTAVGHRASKSNTTGASNVAVGYKALEENTTGGNNTAVGFEAFKDLTTGNSNTAVGRQCAYNVTTGSDNAIFGYNAGDEITTGGSNTCVGSLAGGSFNGSGNTYVGKGAGENATSGNQNIAIGAASGTDAVFNLGTESDRIVMGQNDHTNAYIKIAWTVTSDKRDKIEDGTVDHGLDFVNKLDPKSFYFRKNRDSDEKTGQKRYGFFAQDILELEGSNNVIVDNEDPENLKYKGEHLTPVLVNAIKELSAKNDELAAEIASLKSQINN